MGTSQTKTKSMHQELIATNIESLEEGARLLKVLGGEHYTQGFSPAFASTIGAHFRHVLEHYRCLLGQMKSGVFCYDARERDQLLECDENYAARTIEDIILQLAQIAPASLNAPYQLVDQQTAQPVQTTLERELLFLQSHTVHHYAIIGAMTRAFGKQPEEDFGIAIATRAHQETNGNDQAIGETPPCAQ